MTTLRLADRLVPRTAEGAAVCALVSRHADFLVERANVTDREGRFAAESIELLRETGVLAACAPLAHGGYGLDNLHDIVVLTQQIAEYDASVATACYMHFALTWYFARSVRDRAPRSMANDRWLAELGSRRMVVCSAVAERGADYWNLRTTAEPVDGGWRVNGRKILASISPAATHFYCRLRARTPDGEKLASAMVRAGTPGVRVLDNWDGLGLRGSGSGDVEFVDCFIDADQLVVRGEWGVMTPQLLAGRAVSGVGLCGVSLGLAESAVQAAKAAVHSRARNSASVRSQIADMCVTLAGIRSAVVVAVEDTQEYLAAADGFGISGGFVREAICVGAIAERGTMRIVDTAMRICGGSSYSSGHPLSRIFRDARAAAFMLPYSPPDGWVDFLADMWTEPSGVASSSEDIVGPGGVCAREQ